MTSVQQVRTGAVFLYIETISSMVSGYFFWLIMSKVAPTDVIGLSSALISLSTIFMSITNLGVPNGIQRFIGKGMSNGQVGFASGYVRLSLVITCIAVLGASIAIVALKDWLFASFKVDVSLLAISLLLMGSATVSTLFRSIVIAALKTKILSIISIVSSISKIVISIVLVMAGMGAVGLTLGYSINQVLACILLGAVVISVFQANKVRAIQRARSSIRELMSASAVSWIPAAVASVGLQLGTVLIFGSYGADKAGIYFIALSIMTAVAGVTYSLFNIAYPVLSGMKDGRKKFAWRILKMSLLMSLPISSAILFYSGNVMNLLGPAYSSGSTALQILMISMMPVIVSTAVNILAYAYGNYRQVLAIGLATSLPRVALYFLLVPQYGSDGASWSFTIGSIAGFAASIVIARQMGFWLGWKEIVLITAIPTAASFALSFFHVEYAIGIIASLVVSYLAFLRIGVFTSIDVHNMISVLPSSVSKKVEKILRVVERQRGE